MTSKTVTPEEIIVIHNTIQEEYNLGQGHIKIGVLETVVTQCEGVPFSHEQISILRQAAIIFEGIIRHHIFHDGNKRTALQTTRLFLNRNDYVLVVPLSGTSFIYNIAKQCTTDTEQVLNKIVTWLRRHSARTSQRFKMWWLFAVYVSGPVAIAKFIFKIKLEKLGWLFIKIFLIRDPRGTEFLVEVYQKQIDFFLSESERTTSDS